MKKKLLKESLCGDRIYIKKHDVSLAETMYSYILEDNKRLDKFLPWVEHINSVDDEINYIKSTHKEWDECTYFDYGIFLKDGDMYIGNIAVHSIRWRDDCAELGYWILGKFEGEGYMSEAVLLLDRYLFSEGFHRVQIRCSDLNVLSEKVPIRCNYVYEGTAREDAVEKGKYRNTKTFSKLISDTEMAIV